MRMPGPLRASGVDRSIRNFGANPKSAFKVLSSQGLFQKQLSLPSCFRAFPYHVAGSVLWLGF